MNELKLEHSLILRQLKAFGLNAESLPDNVSNWAAFLARVQKSYVENDQERYLIERSIQISSRELQTQNQKLHWQAQHLKQQIEAVPDGILVVDEVGHILDSNEKFRHLLAPIEVKNGAEISKLWDSLSNNVLDAERFFSLVRSEVDLKSDEGENEFVLKDQRHFEVNMTNLVSEERSRLGSLWCLRDITARKRMQDALGSAAKLSALGMMAGGIAHEINNPLGVIAARASQIKRLMDKQPLDLEKINNFAGIIEDTVFYIASIIKGLRSFSRNADKDPFELVLLKKVISDTTALCGERFRNHDIELVVEVPEELQIRCRPSQMIQILVNLLNNAHDAVLELPKKWVKLEAVQTETNIVISVTDSGEGVAEKISDKIFQPFFTTKEIGKGTGLGLSIVHGLVEAHGGQIILDRHSLNTKFVVSLPLAHHKSGEDTVYG